MVDYVVSVPTFKRPETIKKKTLRVLDEYGIDKSKITVFVSGPEEYEAYSKSLEGKYNIIDSGVKTIGGTRNFIEKYYPEGTYLMTFDDDLNEVQVKISEQKLGRVDDLEKLIQLGFSECDRLGAKTFGLYGAANAYFMKDRTYTKICYILASLSGIIVQHDPFLERVTNHGEDYEYSIRQYIKNGILCRLDNYTLDTAYMKEPGGLQTVRTKESNYKQIKWIADTFPDYCTMYIRESTGNPELRLRDKAPKVTSSLETFFE